MEAGIKLAKEQALAFLIGLAIIAIIQPETSGGTILLILVSVAIYNVIVQSVKYLLPRKPGDPDDID